MLLACYKLDESANRYLFYVYCLSSLQTPQSEQLQTILPNSHINQPYNLNHQRLTNIRFENQNKSFLFQRIERTRLRIIQLHMKIQCRICRCLLESIIQLYIFVVTAENPSDFYQNLLPKSSSPHTAYCSKKHMLKI